MIKWIKKLFAGDPVTKAKYESGIMTVTYESGKVEKYSGSCTVWHKLPYMKRVRAMGEGWLCDLWEYNRQWGGAYPNAHKEREA